MKVFGVSVDVRGRGKAEEAIGRALSGEGKVTIVTLNPEILLKAKSDSSYRDVLDSFDLRVADGFGIFMAGVYHRIAVERVTGRGLLADLLRRADEGGRNVFFALRKGGLTDRTALESVLRERFPRMKATVIESGPESMTSSDSAEIVICGFGAPDQENWIARNRARFPKARVMIGVGGALDVLAGTLPPAPSWLSSIGLEWVWRLVVQPHRWRRIVRAAFVFPLVFIWATFADRKNNRRI